MALWYIGVKFRPFRLTNLLAATSTRGQAIDHKFRHVIQVVALHLVLVDPLATVAHRPSPMSLQRLLALSETPPLIPGLPSTPEHRRPSPSASPRGSDAAASSSTLTCSRLTLTSASSDPVLRVCSVRMINRRVKNFQAPC